MCVCVCVCVCVRYTDAFSIPHHQTESHHAYSHVCSQAENSCFLGQRGKQTAVDDLKRESVSPSVVSDTLRPYGPEPARLLCPWDSPDKNPGVGSLSLLQEIFPTQGSNPGPPAWQAGSLPAELPWKPHDLGQSQTVHLAMINSNSFRVCQASWDTAEGYS